MQRYKNTTDRIRLATIIGDYFLTTALLPDLNEAISEAAAEDSARDFASAGKKKKMERRC